MALLFGGGRNAIRETVEVFRPNAESGAVREAARAEAALGQFAAEFAGSPAGWFDRAVDGLNRLPRPMLALGTIGLFTAAMSDPVWFAARMEGVALIPEPLWWLMGAIVSFYFGARHQTKAQEFRQGMATTLARTEAVARRVAEIEALGALAHGAEPVEADGNAALEDWRRSRDR